MQVVVFYNLRHNITTEVKLLSSIWCDMLSTTALDVFISNDYQCLMHKSTNMSIFIVERYTFGKIHFRPKRIRGRCEYLVQKQCRN